MNKKLTVKIVKNEEKKKLLGPAALNPIVVKDSNIIGAMPNKVPEGALKTPYSYMLGLANKASYEIEQAIAKNEKEVIVEAKMIRSLTDVNMETDDAVSRFLRSNKKTIEVIGPMFVWITAKIEWTRAIPHLLLVTLPSLTQGVDFFQQYLCIYIVFQRIG